MEGSTLRFLTLIQSQGYELLSCGQQRLLQILKLSLSVWILAEEVRQPPSSSSTTALQNHKPHPPPQPMQMRHRRPPLPRILKLIHRRLPPNPSTTTTNILLHKPQPIPPLLIPMLNAQQGNKLVEIQIVDQRAGVARRVGGVAGALVVFAGGEGVGGGDVAGGADDGGGAGFAGYEEG